MFLTHNVLKSYKFATEIIITKRELVVSIRQDLRAGESELTTAIYHLAAMLPRSDNSKTGRKIAYSDGSKTL